MHVTLSRLWHVVALARPHNGFTVSRLIAFDPQWWAAQPDYRKAR